MKNTTYSDELADKICGIISTTPVTNEDLCKDSKFPSVATMYRWRNQYPYFHKAYDEAKRAQVEVRIEDLLQQTYDAKEDLYDQGDGKLRCNNSASNRLRIRCSLLQWHAQLFDRKRYGSEKEASENARLEYDMKKMEELIRKSQEKLGSAL